MRKIFAGAMVFSVIGAVILGGTLAWTSSKTIHGNQAVVGSISWGLGYSQADSALLGPNGTTVLLGHGLIQNTGDYELVFKSGQVIIRNVDVGHSACDAGNFIGTVNDLTGGGVVPIPVEPIDNVNDPSFEVLMAIASNAPSSCQGATVTYDLRITVETAGNGAPDESEGGA